MGSIKAVTGAFSKAGGEFQEEFFKGMLRGHGIRGSVAAGVKRAWEKGDTGTKAAMAVAGVGAGLVGYHVGKSVYNSAKEHPVSTALMVGGLGAGVSFGASALARSAVRSEMGRVGEGLKAARGVLKEKDASIAGMRTKMSDAESMAAVARAAARNAKDSGDKYLAHGKYESGRAVNMTYRRNMAINTDNNINVHELERLREQRNNAMRGSGALLRKAAQRQRTASSSFKDYVAGTREARSLRAKISAGSAERAKVAQSVNESSGKMKGYQVALNRKHNHAGVAAAVGGSVAALGLAGSTMDRSRR